MACLLAALAIAIAGCTTTGRPARDQAGTTTPSTSNAIAPPAQPPRGPGGKQQLHAEVRTSDVSGSPGSVRLFEPAEPKPRSAPVVSFIQGVEPDEYQAWIDHLVAQGNIVVFLNQPFQGMDLAERRNGPVAGLRVAMRELARAGHVRPEWDQLVLVGHSVGGNMAAQLAADSGRRGLPRPKAVFALQPRLEDEESMRLLGGIAPSSLMLVLASDRDDRVGQEGPRAVWAAVSQIPAANKDYVLVRTDEHGPALVADHFLPLSGSGNPPDALDFYGPWKLLDGLQHCAVARRDCRFALGGTAEQRSMGRWSDGVPATPLQVTDSP